MVGSDETHHPTLDHRDGLPAVPDVFPDQGGVSTVDRRPGRKKIKGLAVGVRVVLRVRSGPAERVGRGMWSTSLPPNGA